MRSLTSEVILQNTTLDNQKELLFALLEKNKVTRLQEVYIVQHYMSYPTGGDFCHHTDIALFTGNYDEAKQYYDSKVNLYKYDGENIIADPNQNLSKEKYTLFHGSQELESISIYLDFCDLKVLRNNGTDKDFPNYELKFPLYTIEYSAENDDIEDTYGPYQEFSDALIQYVSEISKMNKELKGEKLLLIELHSAIQPNKNTKFKEIMSFKVGF